MNNILLEENYILNLQEDCFFDIHCVLVTQVNDQKNQRQLTAGVFFSYEHAVVNFHWGYFSLLLVFLGSIESQKSNCQSPKGSQIERGQ